MQKSKLPISHLQSTVEVGKYYSVAGVYIDLHTTDYFFVPVIPIVHEDKAFSNVGRHLHIDARFISDKKILDYFNLEEDGKTSRVIVERKIEYRRRKAVRNSTGIKPPNYKSPFSKRFNNWQKEYVGKSCAGKKCPHYGTIMHDKGTHLECPLHGLIGDKETELIIKNKGG